MKNFKFIFLFVALIAISRTVVFASPDKDVGNVVTVHYDVNYPVAEVPANDLLLASPLMRSCDDYITHQYRRQAKDTKKNIRPPNRQELIE